MIPGPLTAAQVKARAREFGADLVNIVACETLEAHPPDPAWPQVPSRISRRMTSIVITAVRMPWGMFLTMIWQSMLRGVGVYTGCTRCYDVCPVGADYERHLADAQAAIPEATPAKEAGLRSLQGAAARAAAEGLRAHARWIGALPAPAPAIPPR
jgi:ferredoxin